MKLTKPLSLGKSQISYSNYLIDSINLIQQKLYKISRRYFKFIYTDLFKLDFEIPTILELKNSYNLFYSAQLDYKSYLIDNKYDLNIIYKFFESVSILYKSPDYINKNKDEKNKLYNELKLKFNITNDLFLKYNLKIKLKKEFEIKLNKYKNHVFVEELSNIFKSHVFYTVNKLDFRTRNNVVGRCLHRASGLYKYILIDEKSRFRYSCYSDLLKLKEFCYVQYIGKLKTFTKLQLQFKFDCLIKPLLNNLSETYQDLFKMIRTKENLNSELYKNKYLYNLILKSKEKTLFLFGLFDYFSVLTTSRYLSYLLIDFDQCSSGPMIYSLLSGDFNMGNLTNSFPNNSTVCNDLYNFFLESFLLKLDLSDDPLLILIKQNKDKYFDRSFSKLIIMPTFYNMGKSGIKDLLYTTLNKFNELESNLFLIINKLVVLINNLLFELYPYTMKYQEHLVSFCEKLYKFNEGLTIKTLDGSVIKYSYLEKECKYGKIFKNNTSYTYRIYLNFQTTNLKLSKQQVISFPPNYIHSLDGSICRIICNIFYKRTHIILEPLHDSFRISFVETDHLIAIIKYIYTYFFFNNYFHKFKISFDGYYNKLIFFGEKYNDYTKYFPDGFYSPLINYTFLDVLTVNTDLANSIKKSINTDLMYPNYSEEDFFKFYNSEFLFYY